MGTCQNQWSRVINVYPDDDDYGYSFYVCADHFDIALKTAHADVANPDDVVEGDASTISMGASACGWND